MGDVLALVLVFALVLGLVKGIERLGHMWDERSGRDFGRVAAHIIGGGIVLMAIAAVLEAGAGALPLNADGHRRPRCPMVTLAVTHAE